EAVDERVDLLPRGIEGVVEDAPRARDREGSRRAGQLRMAGEPRRGVAGHVELRHDADAAVAGVGDDVLHLLLRVVLAVRPLLVEPRVALALDTEALVL